MKKSKFFLFPVIFCLLALTGCGSSGGGSTPNPIAPVNTGLNMTGPALLSFRMVAPDNSGSINSSILAATNAQVTFEIDVVNVGNTAMPVSTLKKVVQVVDGKAIATFTNLPLKPVVGKIIITGGKSDGYASWRGAMDLKTGTNTMDVSPAGSALKADLMAGAIEDLIKNKTEFEKAPFNLATEMEKVVTSFTVPTDVSSVLTKFMTRNAPPASIPVPEVIASPTTQVKVALNESLKTAVSGFRFSSRANSLPNSSSKLIPIPGGENAMNIGALFRVLPNLLTGGTEAFDTPFSSDIPIAGDASSTLEVEFTSNTIKFKRVNIRIIDYDYTNFRPIYATHSITLTTISGITVNSGTAIASDGSVIGKYISGFSGGDGITFKSERLDVNTQTPIRTFTLKSKGLLYDVSYKRVNQSGKIVRYLQSNTYNNKDTYSSEFGLQYYSVGTESYNITFPSSGEAKFNVTMEEANQTQSSGWITLSGLTGNARFANSVYVGNYYSNWLINDVLKSSYSSPKTYKISTNTVILESPTFLNDTLTIEANGIWPSGGFNLETFKLILPNIVKVGEANVAEQKNKIFDYSFSNGSGNVGIIYNGANPESYGYISKLNLALSNIKYDATKSPALQDWAQVVATTVNTNNEAKTLTYKFIGQKPILQPVTQAFVGGEETVTVSDDGNTTTIDGHVSVQGSDSTASMTYQVTKANTGVITVKVDIGLLGATRSMFFTRDATGNISGRFYLSQKSSDDNTGVLGSFTVTNSGAGNITFASGSGYSGTEYFHVSL